MFLKVLGCINAHFDTSHLIWQNLITDLMEIRGVVGGPRSFRKRLSKTFNFILFTFSFENYRLEFLETPYFSEKWIFIAFLSYNSLNLS